MLIPIFGVAANLICMAAYLVLPFMGYGTKMEPFRLGHCSSLGHLRRHLLHDLQQEVGPDNTGHQPNVICHNIGEGRPS